MTTQEGQRRVGRTMAVSVAAAAVLFALVGSLVFSVPASADQPFEVNDSVTFPDINPCTGNEISVTINFAIRVHEHGERSVVHLSKTGTTDDGYVMNHGVEHQVFNGNNFRAVFTDNWRDADGSKFKAQLVFVENEDGVLVDNFRLRCVGN